MGHRCSRPLPPLQDAAASSGVEMQLFEDFATPGDRYKKKQTRLSTNSSIDESLKALCRRLSQNHTRLVKLVLTEGKLEGIGSVYSLSSALETNTTVQELRLSGNNINHAGAKALAGMLGKNNSIGILSLAWNRIGNEGAVAFGKGLKINTSLTKLYLTGNDVGPPGAIGIADGLRVNATLTELDLCANQIGLGGAKALAVALRNNPSLTSLLLSYNNNIGDEGIGVFFQRIGGGPSQIQTLDLSHTGMGGAGALSLLCTLRTNTTLQSLVLANNTVCSNGMEWLVQGLAENHTLQCLHLGENWISNKDACHIGELLRINRGITKLILCRNTISGPGAQHLANGLASNTCLKELDLSFNPIGNEGAHAFGKLLLPNTTLEWLDLWGTPIGIEGYQALVTGLEGNFHLRTLRITMASKSEECAIQLKLEDMKQYHVGLNNAGRCFLTQEVPTALWAYVLARASHDPRLLYYFLTTNPVLCKR